MTPENRPEANSDTPARGTLPSASRRRLFQGVAGGTGVLLSVQAKTALGAQACRSPSADMSNNTSPRPDTGALPCGGGRSPGFWKVPQKFSFWSTAGAQPPTFTNVVDVCALQGMAQLTANDIAGVGTLFSTAFGDTPAIAVGAARPAGLPVGIWEIMAFPDNFQNGQLGRHLSAAWLNALAVPASGKSYPVTRIQLREMWDATKLGGTYCPSSMLSCSQPWPASKVISYISGMYDDTDLVGPDLCKKNR